MKTNIAVVILAAGESSRMGQSKQLLPWGDEILINHIIKETLNVPYSAHFVVLGANRGYIKKQLHTDIQIIENTNWNLGMGSSIALAIKHLKDDFEAVQFVLVDQPQVESVYLKKMIDVFLMKPTKLVATEYPDSIGIPAIFNQKYFTELEQLTTKGAKSVLKHFYKEVETLKPQPYLEDLDTMKQYKKLLIKIFK